MRRARLAGGFTLLELVIVIIVAGVLAGALLDRLRSYRAQIETLAVSQVVSAIRSEMYLRHAHLIVQDRTAELARLAQENPMEWLGERPNNYAGSFERIEPESIAAGNWYYEKATNRLIYLPSESGQSVTGARKQLNFQVKLVNNKHNADGKNFSQGNQGALLAFVQVSP